MSWSFNRMTPGEMNVDPFEREFFATEALRGVADPLVRESIQNSLDAGVGDQVEVQFKLGEADPALLSRYLEGLWPHVEAGIDDAGGLPDRSGPFTFLAIEDFGTRGLRGDPEQTEDTETSRPDNDFFYFWRNVGRSRKGSTDRGRWGLGKTVFAAASGVRSFFGLTLRGEASAGLLMGQAVLKIHYVDGARYRPYGYFGVHRDGFTLPLSDPSAVRAFAHRFGLRRHHAPGLSVVIPYPDRDITRERLIQSVVEHYFHPLLSGRLRVVIEDQVSSVVLQQDGLEQTIRAMADRGVSGILPMIELGRWGLKPDSDAVVELTAPPAGRSPRLMPELFSRADLERVRQRYDNGRRIALGIRVPIQRKGRESVETRLQLLMERDENLQRGEGHFVRQGITIENSTARRPAGLRWVVVITDPTLSTFLGDAENPAHTEWQRSSPKFKEKYALGPSTIDFLKAMPHSVAGILGRPAEGRDPDLLRGIFSLPEEAAIETPRKDRPSKKGGDEISVPPSDLGGFGQGGKLALSRVKAGFRLLGRSGEGAPTRLRILAAYEVLRGDAFRRYSPLDFDMDSREITVQTRGVQISARRENELELQIREPEIDVVVTGFDENRDLRIKVQPMKEEE